MKLSAYSDSTYFNDGTACDRLFQKSAHKKLISNSIFVDFFYTAFNASNG